MTKASENLFPGIIIRESANDGSDFSNPAADYRRLFLGEDGKLHVKSSSGSVTDPYTGGSNFPTMDMPGTWLGAQSSASAAGSAVTGDIPHLFRVVQPFIWTPTHMGWGCTSSAGSLDLGIYDDDGTGLAPASSGLKCSTGNFSSPGTGRRTRAIASPVELPAGIYWYALVASTGSFQMQYHWAGTGSGGGGPMMCGRAGTVSPAGTLPSTLSSVSVGSDSWAAAIWAEIQ